MIKDKNELRKTFLEKRASLDPDLKKEKDERALENLVKTDDYKKAKNIFTFISTGEEINTRIAIERFLRDGKNIHVPLTKPGNPVMRFSKLFSLDDCHLGHFDITEPRDEFVDFVDNSIVDLVIVPGLVFDKDGYRVGYGGGFYDRFFASIKDKDYRKVGYCYDFQIVDFQLPRNEFDIPVDYIITD